VTQATPQSIREQVTLQRKAQAVLTSSQLGCGYKYSQTKFVPPPSSRFLFLSFSIRVIYQYSNIVISRLSVRDLEAYKRVEVD